MDAKSSFARNSPFSFFKKLPIFWVIILILLLLAGLSFAAGFDRFIAGKVTASDGTLDYTVRYPWVGAFKLLGNSWLQVWLLLLYSWAARKPRIFVNAAIALILVAILVSGIKTVTGRPRPREANLQNSQAAVNTPAAGGTQMGPSKSFPSGDTSSAFAAAGVVANAVNPLVGGVLMVAAGAIAVLRVTSLAHYPSDVLAGAALGLVIAFASIRLSGFLEWDWQEMCDKKWRITPLVLLIVLTFAPGWIEKEHYILHFLKFYCLVPFLILFTYRKNLNRIFAELFTNQTQSNRFAGKKPENEHGEAPKRKSESEKELSQ